MTCAAGPYRGKRRGAVAADPPNDACLSSSPSADPAAVLRRVVDAPEVLAGAEGRPDRLVRAVKIGRNPDPALARNDSQGVLAAPG